MLLWALYCVSPFSVENVPVTAVLPGSG
ncbi:hypothetical protein EQO02_14200 [Escherichia coli]|nr:hypothetical protein [Escherichia coli]